MRSFAESNSAYEDMLARRLDNDLVRADLDGKEGKHAKMAESAFLFLRGTCFRWAEAAAGLCESVADAPLVPSVGDSHAGNFGLWRDAEARLVWGVNDYDEAARLPYVFDLVRLCTSIALAQKHDDPGDVAREALLGYREGLTDPRPFVLERDHIWLRDAFAASDKKRQEFWDELKTADAAKDIPARWLKPLLAAIPPVMGLRLTTRSAGVGSLGRPRFVAAGMYRGGPVAVEIKAQLPSCFKQGRETGLAGRMAAGPWRAPDPSFVYTPDYAIRRLAPNNRKLDFEKLDDEDRRPLIRAMARDLAAVHAGEGHAVVIARHLDRVPADWLETATATTVDWTVREFERYRP